MRWERDQYAAFPNKGSAGSPLAYSLVSERGRVRLRLWPVPQTDVVILATAVLTTDDVTDGSQDINVPQEWTKAVIYGLADRLSNVFGVNEQSLRDVKNKATMAYGPALSAERPSSFFFEAG